MVLVEKMPFTQETIKNLLTGNTTFTHNSQHDNVGQYTSDAVHPATEKHVKDIDTVQETVTPRHRHTHQDAVTVQETATASMLPRSSRMLK